MKKESALKKNVKLVVESKLLSKILPRRISALSFLEQSEESTEDIPVEPPPDPFNLRYDERLASKKIRTRHVSDPVIPVLVKRPFAHKPPVVRPFTLGLQLALDEKKQSLTLYEPLSQFTRSKVIYMCAHTYNMNTGAYVHILSLYDQAHEQEVCFSSEFLYRHRKL